MLSFSHTLSIMESLIIVVRVGFIHVSFDLKQSFKSQFHHQKLSQQGRGALNLLTFGKVSVEALKYELFTLRIELSVGKFILTFWLFDFLGLF